MPKTIHKFEFPIQNEIEILMPIGAEVCHVGLGPAGNPCVWAIVDPAMAKEGVLFHVIGTGHSVPEEGIFIGSFVMGAYVWHLFMIP